HPEPEALHRAVAGAARGGGAQPRRRLWRTRFVTAGAVELDDPPAVLEVEALYAATNITA
ncbi:MAG TPA: hypothetical protein VGW38_26390, partial [Chloroflexota bacterium]|nr:hypothetical protein [Chloroflexota bacterium]